MKQHRGLVSICLYLLRSYVRRFPIRRGKTFIIRRLIQPLLRGTKGEFLREISPGCLVELSCHEDVGLGVWLYDHFEKAELDCLLDLVKPGDLVCDIGANVGLFTVPLAAAVGLEGCVWSFEPLRSNVLRLKENIARNGLTNIDIFPIALADFYGQVRLVETVDSAYGYIQRNVTKKDVREESVDVETRRLDDIWKARGRPPVRLVKIDVEGAESMVIDGGTECFRSCHPHLIVEANLAEDLKVITEKLRGLGYTRRQPNGFRSWNWLFQYEAQ